MRPYTDEERQTAEIIFEETLGKVSLGFDPEVLKILDDPESSEKERETIKEKISQEIAGHLMQLANSAYFGKISLGKVA